MSTIVDWFLIASCLNPLCQLVLCWHTKTVQSNASISCLSLIRIKFNMSADVCPVHAHPHILKYSRGARFTRPLLHLFCTMIFHHVATPTACSIM